MSALGVSVGEILAQFDAVGYGFPHPDNEYFYAVDARLHAFADRLRWALVIELVSFNPSARGLFDALFVFGNCLNGGEPGAENEDYVQRIENFAELEGEFGLAGGAPTAIVRGQPLPVAARRGEALQDVFRCLVPPHRELFLADQTELRRRIPADLPEVLTLDDWHQLNLAIETPSSSETYQQLADVLEMADPSKYHPTLPGNMRWENWPNSGVC